MSYLSIRNMNRSMDLRQQLLEAQLKGRHVVNTTTPSIKPALDLDPIEDLQSKICNELAFIAKYKSSYRRLAIEALARAKYYRRRIADIQEEREQQS